MKLFLSLLFIIAILTQSNAQNPFQSIGKEVTVLTLSNGQYKEFHPNDSLRQIGSVIVNMRTGKIHQLLSSTTPSGEINQERMVASRWFSVDPLASKYPNISPYAFTANNPILYIEKDGRDFGVYIDHETHTITIKATFHTVKGVDADLAHLGADLWCEQSGKFIYTVGEGDAAINYSINFDLTVVEHSNAKARDKAFTSDNSVESNKFKTQGDWVLGRTEGEKGNERNSISINSEKTPLAKKRNTPGHEMGHGFGIGHWLVGLMNDGYDRKDDEQQITVGNVSRILNQAGIGQLNEVGVDFQDQITEGKAKFEINTTNGKAPEGFESGKVVTAESVNKK